jgi:hypothetical protein
MNLSMSERYVILQRSRFKITYLLALQNFVNYKARYRLNRKIGKCLHDDEKQCKENIELFWKQFDR